METEQKPITETKEALLAAFKIGGAIKAAGADGKYDLADVAHLIPVFPYVGKAIENGKDIPAEVSDIDAVEFAELESFIISELGELIDKEKLLLQISAGLKFIKATHDLYKTFA